MYITLYFTVTHLPDSLRAVRDHFLALDPTALTVDLLEQHLLAAETSVIAVGAARGTPGMPFFEGCSPSPLAPSYASGAAAAAAAADVPGAVDVGAASASAKHRSSKGKGGRGGGDGSGGGGGGSSGGGGGSGGGGSSGSGGGSGGFGGGGGGNGGSGGSGSCGGGGGRTGTLRGGSGRGQRQQQHSRSETQTGVAIFDLDFDAILAAMYALSASAEGDCYLCVPPDPDIEAAALGASESVLPGTAPAEALHTFTLDSRASRCFFRANTTLTPLSARVPVRLADPSRGPYRCPPGRDGHYHRSWGSACVDLHVYTNGPSPGHVHSSAKVESVHTRYRASSGSAVCSGVRIRSGGTPLLVSPPVEPDPFVAPPPGSPLPAMPSWHALPLPSRVSGHGRERYFLLVVDVFTRYTTFFPLRSKGQVVDFLIPLIRTVRLQLRERFHMDLPILRLQSDSGAPHLLSIARTSMIHAAAPHFLWPFAVRYAAHQLNLWPRSRASVRNTSADKLSARAIPCVFLGFVPEAPSWQFYHPTSRRVFPSLDVNFDESGPTPLGVSQVDPLPGTTRAEVAVGSGAAPGAASWGAEHGGAEPGGAGSAGAGSGGAEPGCGEPAGVEPGGAEPEGVEPGGIASEGAESGGAELRGTASSGGPAGATPRLSPRPQSLSPQKLREWFAQHTRLRSGAAEDGDSAARDSGAGGAGVAAGAGGTGGAAAAGPGGARTGETGASGTGGVGGARAGDPTEPRAAGAGGAGAVGAGAEGTGAGGAGAGGAGAVDPGAGGAGGTVRPRPYFVPLLQQVLGVPSSTGLPPPFLCPPPDQSQPSLQPASPLPAPSPYTEKTGDLTERREPASRPASPVCTGLRVPRPRPAPVPGTHAMALRPSSIPLRVPLPPPPKSSLLAVPDPESDRACAASPTVSRLLATVVTDPTFESNAMSALVAELVAEFESASPPSVWGECALSTDVLEDRQEDFECLAAAVPRFASIMLAPEKDPDAPEILTPRSYAEAITGPYSSQWQVAMDAEMASWKSTGTYVNAVPPFWANIVDGMWIFRVKWPPGSPPAFKARYVARGFSQRQGVDYVAAQRDYELHSLDFSTQWSLRRPIYGLRQAPREWHDTLRTTLAALGFTPSTADPLVFLHTDTSLTPFYVFVYVDDLVFATADTEALTLVKSELQKRHTCTDLGEQRSYLGLQITQDREWRTITPTQSHMVHLVLQRFGFQFSSPQPTPLSTGHSLSAPPSDESVEPSGPYPELVGCLMYLMTCTRPDLAYPLSLLARCVAPGMHRKVHWDAAKRVLRYLCSTSGMGLVVGGRGPVVLTGHADASWVDDLATQRSSQGYTFSLGSGSVSWRSTRSSSVLSASCEAEIYAGAMAAQELCWLTYLLTDLGEQPRSPPVLYVDNKVMIALCQEHTLEHRTKHIALRYFLARELQQRGQLRLAYVATRANTADIFTKALPPGDHQRFSTMLGLVPTLPHLLTA
ncbi:unnamed protein product [Closterium sp. NIES-53]